ncbi:MAG: hypothetical protein ACRC92_18705 [Peptostreptococcaceae bacterium]
MKKGLMTVLGLMIGGIIYACVSMESPKIGDFKENTEHSGGYYMMYTPRGQWETVSAGVLHRSHKIYVEAGVFGKEYKELSTQEKEAFKK